MESSEHPSPPETRNQLQRRTYEIDGHNIVLSSKEFLPKDGENPANKAIIFLPGWSAGTAKTLENMAGAFANEGQRRVLFVTTRPEHVIPTSLYLEARAVREMMLERGLEEVTLVAHSEGGTKAANLIDILQKENPEIQIAGLVLMGPVGLYEQGKAELASGFAYDSLVSTPKSIAKGFFKDPSLLVKGMQSSSDIIFNIAKEVKSSGLNYWSRISNQIKEMAKANTHYQDIRCPVVLIQGASDPASNSERVIPSDKVISYRSKAEGPSIQAQRRKILQETFFPNASETNMVVPNRLGHHGLPHFRPDEIARVSLYLLDRNRYRDSHRR